jgi:SAM-dependent methyltransferase
MEIIDRKNIISEFSKRSKIILELGCGPSKRIAEAISIDILNIPEVDIVADLSKGFPFIPDNCVDEIYSFHFMEHLPDLELFMRESLRILKPGGKIAGTVPHFSNPYFYSDYTHKNFFGLYTFCYFSKNQPFKRKVPVFYSEIDLEIRKINLIFKSPFLIRKVFRVIWGKIVNSCRFMLEFYEGSMTGLIPVYEIEFELIKK